MRTLSFKFFSLWMIDNFCFSGRGGYGLWLKSRTPDRARALTSQLRAKKRYGILPALLFGLVCASSTIAQTTPPPEAAPEAQEGRKDDCVLTRTAKSGLTPEREIRTYKPGAALVSVDSFLPAGATADFILREKLLPKVPYFARIETDFDGQEFGKNLFRITHDNVSAHTMPANHPALKSGLASADDTLISIDVPPAAGSVWKRARVFVYACTGDSPSSVSAVNIHVSSPIVSSAIVWALIASLYGFAAYGAMALDASEASRSEVVVPKSNDRNPKKPWFPRFAQWWHYLNPVVMTAGPDGRGSLSKLQIMFFSMVVFGLLLYLVLRTGLLSDLSETILILLGITGISSTAAKAADQNSTRLDPGNWLWLAEGNWTVDVKNKACWRDIVTTDGEFDIYRYQSCIFSLIVGVALIASGLGDLASFTIPTTLLGLLGMSQVVYLAGKVVSSSSTSILALNEAVTKARGLENDFRAAVNKDPAVPPASLDLARTSAPSEHAHFKTAIVTVETAFKLAYRTNPKDGHVVEPGFGEKA